MKMFSGSLKGLIAVLVGWFTYIDKTFTPLFWVLLALVALDMLLNVHKEGQQFAKMGSMAISLGVPSYVSSNVSDPELGKYLVAIMCLVYLQLVVPQLVTKLASMKLSNDPKVNASEQAALVALIERVDKLAQSQAQKEVQQVPRSDTDAPNTPPTSGQ